MKKKPRKIGFFTDDDREEPEQEAGTIDLKEMLLMLYKPNGFTNEKDFKSAIELAYELSDMIEVSTRDVAKAMTDLGFEVTTIDNQVCFVVFTKNTDEK